VNIQILRHFRVVGFLTLAFLLVLAGTFLLPIRAQEADETSEERTQTFWWQVSATGPSERSGHAMVYDSGRGMRVVFGGEGSSGHFGDTWEWDGINWRCAATSGPSPRHSHSMAYDSARGKVVLFGGNFNTDDPSRQHLNDTWEWDGSSWTQIRTVEPPGREGHAMAYDSARRVVVLFGGLSWQSGEGNKYLNDT